VKDIREIARDKFPTVNLAPGDNILFTVKDTEGEVLFRAESEPVEKMETIDEAVAFQFSEGLGLTNGYGLAIGRGK